MGALRLRRLARAALGVLERTAPGRVYASRRGLYAATPPEHEPVLGFRRVGFRRVAEGLVVELYPGQAKPGAMGPLEVHPVPRGLGRRVARLLDSL